MILASLLRYECKKIPSPARDEIGLAIPPSFRPDRQSPSIADAKESIDALQRHSATYVFIRGPDNGGHSVFAYPLAGIGLSFSGMI